MTANLVWETRPEWSLPLCSLHTAHTQTLAEPPAPGGKWPN